MVNVGGMRGFSEVVVLCMGRSSRVNRGDDETRRGGHEVFQVSGSDGYIARGICLSGHTAVQIGMGKVARREGCGREEGRGEGIDV